MSNSLEGLVVLELASVLAGPAAGQFLAEMGATVIKVENPHTRGDVTRGWKLPEEDPASDRSAYFNAINWGKRSLAIDLGQEAGRMLMQRLARTADIVITSYKPGGGAALGADPGSLRAANDRLIVAQVIGYADDDPRPGYDAVIQAEAGFMGMNGAADGPPVKLPVALMDVLAAHQLKEGILLALLRRERTGEGATLTVSLFEAAVAALANQASNYLGAGHLPDRAGSDHPNIAPYGAPFRTADGHWLVLAVGTGRQFQELCKTLGLDELAGSPTFATNQKRVRNRLFLHALLEERIGTWQRDQLLTALHDRKVPAGAIRNLKEVMKQAPEMVLRAKSVGAGAVRTAAVRMDGQTRRQLSPPPGYAADTDSVLAEFAGADAATLDQLRADQVVH